MYAACKIEGDPIIYRDDAILVVDKPAGMLVHRGWGRDSVVLVDIVRRMSGNSKAYPIHRLDRGASGVVLFALDAGIAGTLGQMQRSGQIEKRYLALVRGCPPGQGVIDHPIPGKPGGQRRAAATSYRLLATAECRPRTVSLVEVRPHTGRLHQVRRHLKHISHPLIGDANYGKGALNRALAENYGLHRLALHACRLELPHPLSGERLVITSPLPDNLKIPLELMGFSDDGFLTGTT
ncbi:MAG TPA: pseudouridine synthase [Myxococcota bacterium]|nr:pseudouridine synthase [Myxococcota bacterium]